MPATARTRQAHDDAFLSLSCARSFYSRNMFASYRIHTSLLLPCALGTSRFARDSIYFSTRASERVRELSLEVRDNLANRLTEKSSYLQKVHVYIHIYEARKTCCRAESLEGERGNSLASDYRISLFARKHAKIFYFSSSSTSERGSSLFFFFFSSGCVESL